MTDISIAELARRLRRNTPHKAMSYARQQQLGALIDLRSLRESLLLWLLVVAGIIALAYVFIMHPDKITWL